MASAAAWALAAACLVAGIIHQNTATAPIGEGELFVDNARLAAEIITAGNEADVAVRVARNTLEVEAVSLIDSSGMIVTSTSSTLEGRPIASPVLEFGLISGRFAALADSVTRAIEIDGIPVWSEGSILYQVLQPLEDGSALLLHYDVSELLARRTQPGEIQPLTLQLIALGGVFGLLGAAVFVGHTRAVKRHRDLTIQTDILRAHSVELEDANARLADARARAEEALALAEEKMRIRSEFVLMINHELRTPLTSVVTGARLLESPSIGSEERRELVRSMVSQAERLDEIIDQILAVARIENRGLAYDLVETPLVDVCEAVGVDNAVEGDPYTVAVRTDVPTLGLIIGSLCDNALTHGARTVTAGCSVSPVIEPMFELGSLPRRSVYFTVSDDGPGIDPDFLPRAFEKFEKNSFSSGTGIGLYMVRLMVEALGGSVGVTTASTGTTFQIALPATSLDRTMEEV